MEARRRQNVYWTLSQDYGYHYQKEASFFKLAEEGWIHRRFGRSELETYLDRYYGQYSNFEDIHTLAYLLAGLVVREDLLAHRPGLKSYEEAHYKALERALDRKGPKNIREELLFAQSRDYLGKPLISGQQISSLLKDLKSGKDLESKEAYYAYLEELIETYFHVNPSLKKEATEKEAQEEKKEKDKNQEKKDPISPKKKDQVLKLMDLGEAQSAEFTSIKLDELDPDSMVDPGLGLANPLQAEKLRQVTRRCGKNILKPLEKAWIEKDISKGIHQGMEIHLSRGDYEEDLDSRYFQDMEKDQRRKTEAAFEKNRHIYRRMIFELREIVRKGLMEDQREASYQSHSGEIDPSRAWRYDLLGDENIFKRAYLDEEASFTVDILLDMSGSQIDRQEEVAIQGYIITEALQSLHIPTRVMGYQNLFHLQVIRLFRDYKDRASRNKDIFSYRAGGSNRDGYALRYVFKTMEKDPETNILIILSDGRPNDKLYSFLAGGDSQAQDYTGEEAVYDTAAEILQGKLNNIAILGIFTGEEKDIDKERLIYGSDFVWTRDVSRFSSLVGKYLKSLISQLG
ncbi:MAG: hypothetical protein Q4E37_05260 [Tissierellia bacterium]|nr:hypothetical protein [Tissierellia bacterium]